jgi:predicted  nucleic acid-binding Zn-ribbon protein
MGIGLMLPAPQQRWRFDVAQESLASIPQRVGALVRLLTTLDQRLVETFETVERVGEAAAGLEALQTDGADMLQDARRRVTKFEKRVNADLDEVKAAVLAKLEQVDVADVKRRITRLEKRVNADLDELKTAVLDKLADVDVEDLTRRLDSLEESIRNIEVAVSRVDTTVEGAVEAAPNFVTRRVRERQEEIEQELPGTAAGG